MSLFENITALATLEAAWEKVKDNAGAAGGDGETVADFAAQAPSRLLVLHRALRSGRYHPGPLRPVLIPKRSGGTRPLSIPSVVDRVAQCAAALVLTPVLDAEMAEGSFGYRPGRSVRQAVARIEHFRDAGYQWVIDADIERYFETVPHDPLMERLRPLIDDAATLDLIEHWLVAGADGGRGLPQGSPLSPLLSNLYLDSFDDDIEQGAVRLVDALDAVAGQAAAFTIWSRNSAPPPGRGPERHSVQQPHPQARGLPGGGRPRASVRLTGDGRRQAIRAYEKWLDRPVQSQRNGRKVVWRRLIEEQVLAYARSFAGDEAYAPYRMDY